MTQEEFLLKWNDHHASFFTLVEDLCRTEQLCDVTLACGGQVFETHKLILSVCSPYFATLLNLRPHTHPIALSTSRMSILSNWSNCSIICIEVRLKFYQKRLEPC